MSEKQIGIEFDICRNNHGGNEESSKAFKLSKKGKNNNLNRLFDYIKSKGTLGCTSDEAGQACGIYIQTASAACSELKALGLVVKQGTRLTSRGSPAAVLVSKEFV